MRQLKFTPTGDRVLVEPIAINDSTTRGILIPDAHKDKPSEGIVVSLGTGGTKKDGTRTEFPVKIGDRVIFNRFEGTEVKIGDGIFKMFKSDELLAVIE
jgi:chaperonin GroES